MKQAALEQTKNFSFVFPALLIFSLFYIYPFIYTFILSLYRSDGIAAFTFVGIDNFKEIIFEGGKDWWPSIFNAGLITFFALTLQNALAFALALGVDKAIKAGKFYRVIFFILPILSEIIIGLLMREILISEFPANIGVFNSWLKNAGLGFLAHDWLSTDVLLKFKFLGINITLTHALITVALVHCWKGFGWAFVIFLAGLQTIPEQLYEAARIDGASSWQSFFKITLPLLMSVMALIFILTILGTMQAFAMILALTRGSGGLTEVPTMRIYNHVKTSQVGLACAEGVILGIILIVVSRIINTVYKKIRQRWGVLPN